MKKMHFLTLLLILSYLTNAQVHTTYLWHLEQPIYWPESSQWVPTRYQMVWESQFLKQNNGNWYSDGKQHPENNLSEIFSNDDRKAAYQYRTKDAVQTLLGHSEAGAQVNYSGCLMENVNSLANAGQMGYYNGWQNNYITARQWATSGGKPRMDITGFSMHHALSPLISYRMLRKQIQAHKYIYAQNFGSSPAYSKGYWPAECSFSEHNIKALVDEGFEWSVIANSHLARTLADYPVSFGTNGCNIDPPNKADIIPVNGNNWWNGQIDGRGGTFAAPFCYQAHKAKYVDPNTGAESKITVVPMCDLLSYKNGYATMGTGEIDANIAPYNVASQPSIVLMAHDGDNAWGGGYDYYMNSVQGFANEAASKGYVPTTIQQFLTDHPVPETDVVHVEDGSWVNVANDWGHPQYINWLWPMYNASYQFDPNGWTEDVRNWAVLVAAENRVETAEDLSGALAIGNVVNPGSGATAAEKAWHFLLPAYNSGYMYYGTSLDMEVKQSLACNIACDYADQVIAAHPGQDATPPTVFIPQRYPYNPGGTGFGPTYGYQQKDNGNNFHVWTFVADVSGLQAVTLKYRADNDGLNPLSSNQNETYAGGSEVGAWQSITMTSRAFPTGNVTNNPEINFFILPDYIATQYYAEITGFDEQLVDYYVEATDTKGNITKSPIQHVYVGNTTNTTGGGGGGTVAGVGWLPQSPTTDQVITITVTGATQGAKLHWGVKLNGTNWQTPDQTYWPAGTTLFNGVGAAVETTMIGPDAQGNLTLQLGPFNNAAQIPQGINFVLHYNNNTWNNNNGQDFNITLSPGSGGGGITQTVSWTPTTPKKSDYIIIKMTGATQGAQLVWGVTTNGQSWQTPIAAYQPTGTSLYNGIGPKVQSNMIGPDINGNISILLGPFSNAAQVVDGIDFDILFADGTWKNNNGLSYHPSILNQTGGVETVSWFPTNPTNNDIITVTVQYANKAGKLHWGVNNWASPNQAYWPVNSFLFNGTGPAVQSPMIGPDANGHLTLSIGPFNNTAQSVQAINFVINYNNNTWNNNNNQNYNITITPKVLNLTMLLEGLYDGTLPMRKAQNTLGNQYTGTVAERLNISLHNSSSPFQHIYTFSDQNLNTDGSLQCQVPGNLNGSYYLALKNRNHLETWSATPVSLAGVNTSYNFSDAASKAYGNNLKQKGSVWVLMAGDVNQDDVVDGLDLIQVDNQAAALTNGYVTEDINGDGTVDAMDLLMLELNAATFVRSISP